MARDVGDPPRFHAGAAVVGSAVFGGQPRDGPTMARMTTRVAMNREPCRMELRLARW